ncbi:TRDC protein, partial [Podilymbus podiceps]|nr:TRDC protein [Podilymbus podiceps]
MKSKKLKEDSNTGNAACLARNLYTKNINLEMSSTEVVYQQPTPVLTSEGLYNTIKVVNVTKGTEVICTAKFNDRTITANTTLPGTFCGTAATYFWRQSHLALTISPAMEKANMLSIAVLGLRVLLAKSIAFNTLMSIKLFLF